MGRGVVAALNLMVGLVEVRLDYDVGVVGRQMPGVCVVEGAYERCLQNILNIPQPINH